MNKNPKKTEKLDARGEVKINDILKELGLICPYGSFRHYANECGLYDMGKQVVRNGRVMWLFPREAIEKMRRHLETRFAARKEAKNNAIKKLAVKHEKN